MDQVEVIFKDSQYCRKCPSCRRQIRCDSLQELAKMFAGADGQGFGAATNAVATLDEVNMFINHQSQRAGKTMSQRAGFDLDACYDTHEEFVEVVSTFLKQRDDHKFDITAQRLSSTFCIDNDVSIGACAVTTDCDLQRRVPMLLRSDVFDCSGYYFHLQHAHERRDGAKYSFNFQKEYFECHGEFHISFSKTNASATVIYEHNGHTESRNHTPRQIYRNMIQMTNVSDFEKPEAHVITRKQVYNFWISLTQGEWHREVDDFKSAQLLVADQDGYELLQEPGISLDFVTPCFTDSQKFDRAKVTEVFIDATFGTTKKEFELYCFITEYDLVSLPLSYLLLDTRGIQENGKRVGSRLTTWLMELRNARLTPKW
ncbi:hypothetical protein V1508DRAFT_407263 [Lipomyces doorenjongii]|uniref:uncharacterized protein n=1 Tax=Lipomyces doorenjongii TaxID=383834 RepID=UPI0034CF1274